MTLVEGLLAPREGDLDLGAAVLEVQRQRDDRQPLLVDPLLDLVYLGAVEQELALAPGGVVVPGALEVLRDVHAVQPDLVTVDLREAVDQRRATGPQRLHLGALEDHAGLEGVLDVVVVARLLVLRDEPAPLLLGHPSILSGGPMGLTVRSRCVGSYNQLIGFTATPSCITVKWVWQPVDHPVVPM